LSLLNRKIKEHLQKRSLSKYSWSFSFIMQKYNMIFYL
jgi:hypothetical protein